MRDLQGLATITAYLNRNRTKGTADMDYLEIGPTPAAEDCIQAGTDPAAEKAECRRFIDWIREVLGPEPQGCALRVKGSPHDFGTYYEVFCYFDENTPESIAYAFTCEGSLPERWAYTMEQAMDAREELAKNIAAHKDNYEMPELADTGIFGDY